MKNYIQEGENVPATAPYAVVGGDGVLVGALFGVAYDAAASGSLVTLATEGVFTLKAASADTPTQWAIAYWDNTNRQVTTVSAGNTKVGTFAAAKAAGVTLADVRLNGFI